MTQMLAQREHDYFAETVICANCYIVAKLTMPAQQNCVAWLEIRTAELRSIIVVELILLWLWDYSTTSGGRGCIL